MTASPPAGRRFLLALARLASTWLAFALGVLVVPHRWCMRDADRWFARDPVLQESLARGVERFVRGGVGLTDFDTGNAQFNGEWLFGSYLMAGFGFGQLALAHPERRDHYLPLLEYCLDQLQTPEVREFDRASWQRDPIDALGSDEDHAAYLGYFNLLLGLHRQLVPESRFTALHDAISEHLARRLAASPIQMLVTYPGEVYPVDNCAVVGSLGLHARVTERGHPELVKAWVQQVRARYLDPESGLLVQALDFLNGRAVDAPRGSGTSLGLYFLSFADDALARDMYQGLRRSLGRTFLGFGAVREYPAGVSGTGDIDSGPILLGYGLSPTGFALAGSLMYGDHAYFRRLVSSAYLAGAPLWRGDRLEFVTGGPLGNAILLAMLTAGPGRASP